MTGVTGDSPETFAAFAVRIGKSRPYVSKLVAEGRIAVRSLTPERLIIPHLALEDIAAAADPARTPRGRHTDHDGERTYAQQRARKTRTEADRAELELQARRGELVDRSILATILAPRIREMRDSLMAAPRDTVPDPVQCADCEAAIAAALDAFAVRLAGLATEIANHGGVAAG